MNLSGALLSMLNPEPAHQASIWALKYGLGGHAAAPDPRISMKIWGQTFPSPFGMAAGFDKQGQVMSPLLNLGLGFVEVGTITPNPQSGNPRPRVFRAPKQQAVINRYGFNSSGHDVVYARLAAWRTKNPEAALGVNLGMNKTEKNPLHAYISGIKLFEGLASYLVINLSSPNTKGLRDQQTEGLRDLIRGIKDAQTQGTPLLAKVAPDLDDDQIKFISQVAMEEEIDGLIISNTTLDRPENLPKKFSAQRGGLSGAPLKNKALLTLKRFYSETSEQIPLVGVGGIMSGLDAVERIKAGATLIQSYTGIAFQGPDLIQEVNVAILKAMQQAGVTEVAKLRGMA